MTIPKPFFKLLNPPAIISLTTLVAAAALAAILVCSSPRALAGDSAPDWLRSAAQEKLPEISKDAVAVILLDEQVTTVKDNGDIETRHRRAYKLLRPESHRDYSYVSVNFDNETKITFFKAWTITPDGKQMEVKDKDAVEISVGDFEVFSDNRAKYIEFPEAHPGSIVGYEYVQKHRPFVFEDSWDFQNRVPTVLARFSLVLPPGWEFTNYWSNAPKQEPQSPLTNEYVWEVQNISGLEEEPDMPPYNAIAGHMDVKYFPRDPNLRTKTTGSWIDIGLWFNGLTSASRVPSPALQQKVTELTAGLADPLAKMEALSSYVQRQIRYVAIEIGIGGLQPHPAADVFKHQYGDCKDKATLLSTMLAQIGIDSYYVMIHTDRGVVNPNFPSINGNHMVLAIHIPDGVPTTTLYGLVDDPKLGHLLFFDPTNSYVPLGYLPSYLQLNYGLLMAPTGGKLILLPLSAPATNRLLRTATLSLTPSGNLSGQVQELRWGGPAMQSRALFLTATPANRPKVIEEFLGNSLTNFSFSKASVGNLENYDKDFTLSYGLAVEGYAKTAGDLLIVRPRVLGAKGSDILAGKERKYPIEFDEATRQDDVFDITLPAGYVVDELPKPVNAECPYGSYKSTVQVQDNILHYKRSYEITDILVPTDKFPEVRAFFRAIASDEKSSAVLRRSNP
jgi:hypothetical protein